MINISDIDNIGCNVWKIIIDCDNGEIIIISFPVNGSAYMSYHMDGLQIWIWTLVCEIATRWSHKMYPTMCEAVSLTVPTLCSF